MVETVPMPMCPMAATCKGMMEKPISVLFMMTPGVVFIAVGMLILIEPEILAWLVAAASIAVGVVMLMVANLVSRIGARIQRTHA